MQPGGFGGSRGLIPRVVLHAIFNACQRPGAMGVLPMALGFLIQRQKGVSRPPRQLSQCPLVTIVARLKNHLYPARTVPTRTWERTYLE